jgi:hypothetical protein
MPEIAVADLPRRSADWRSSHQRHEQRAFDSVQSPLHGGQL